MYPLITAVSLIVVLALAILSVFWLSNRRRARKASAPIVVGRPRTFLKTYAFSVKIPGFVSSFFSSCSAVSEFGEHAVIQLRRAVDPENVDMVKWAASGDARAVVICALSRDGEVKREIYFGKARPSAYSVGPFDNASDDNLMETLHLVRAAEEV